MSNGFHIHIHSVLSIIILYYQYAIINVVESANNTWIPFPGTSIEYIYIAQCRTWQESMKYCQYIGGELASGSTSAKRDFIVNTVFDDTAPTGHCTPWNGQYGSYVGGITNKQDTITWFDGTSTGFYESGNLIDWDVSENEPDNLGTHTVMGFKLSSKEWHTVYPGDKNVQFCQRSDVKQVSPSPSPSPTVNPTSLCPDDNILITIQFTYQLQEEERIGDVIPFLMDTTESLMALKSDNLLKGQICVITDYSIDISLNKDSNTAIIHIAQCSDCNEKDEEELISDVAETYEQIDDPILKVVADSAIVSFEIIANDITTTDIQQNYVVFEDDNKSDTSSDGMIWIIFGGAGGFIVLCILILVIVITIKCKKDKKDIKNKNGKNDKKNKRDKKNKKEKIEKKGVKAKKEKKDKKDEEKQNAAKKVKKGKKEKKEKKKQKKGLKIIPKLEMQQKVKSNSHCHCIIHIESDVKYDHIEDVKHNKNDDVELELAESSNSDNKDKKQNLDEVLIKSWLNEIEMAEYFKLFIQNGYESMEFIKEIVDKSELKEIGINTKEHQKLIMIEINKLKDDENNNDTKLPQNIPKYKALNKNKNKSVGSFSYSTDDGQIDENKSFSKYKGERHIKSMDDAYNAYLPHRGSEGTPRNIKKAEEKEKEGASKKKKKKILKIHNEEKKQRDISSSKKKKKSINWKKRDLVSDKWDIYGAKLLIETVYSGKRTISTKTDIKERNSSFGKLIINGNKMKTKWDITIKNGDGICIGICSFNKNVDLTTNKNKKLLTQCFTNNINGYGYVGNNGGIQTNGRCIKYGKRFKNGDKISILLNMNKKTLSFILNGENQGVAFKDLPSGQYRLAASFGGKLQKITLNKTTIWDIAK